MGNTAIRRRVTLKSEAQIALMREAGRIVAETLQLVEREAQPGVTTATLDALAEQHIRRSGAVPSFKNYRGFPATLCTSLNDEIVHGIPSHDRALREGDLLKVDCGAIFHGWHGDAAISFIVRGPIHGSEAASATQIDGLAARMRLISCTQEALQRGIAAMQSGARLSDIGRAIEQYALGEGFEVVREYCGHGIGRSLHEEPAVHNFGHAGEGLELRPGMVLAIEPMLNAGTWRTTPQPDGWTVKTADGKLSAHFEHTVAVTGDGPRVLTLP